MYVSNSEIVDGNYGSGCQEDPFKLLSIAFTAITQKYSKIVLVG